MKKLRLELEDLEVSSFVADDRVRDRGTVRGHTGETDCPWTTDGRNTYNECSVYFCPPNQNTWAGSCQYGTGCQDSIIVCGSHYCPLQPAPSAPDC